MREAAGMEPYITSLDWQLAISKLQDVQEVIWYKCLGPELPVCFFMPKSSSTNLKGKCLQFQVDSRRAT